MLKKTVSNNTYDTFNLHAQDQRMCETFHSSDLNAIFFDTLDEIDCLRNPFSILK